MEIQDDGVVRFARAVRASKASCVACHSPPDAAAALKRTNIIGIVSLKMSPKGKKP